MRRPQTPDVWSSGRRGGIPSITTGVVVAVRPGSNQVSVRLSNLSGHTVENVTVPAGQTFQSGDRVLLTSLPHSPSWVAITKILDTDEYGLWASQQVGERELHPPNNFTVVGGVGLVMAQWDAYTGNTVCWEIEHNSSPTTAGSSSLYTRGSYFLYPSVDEVTRYVRVRAVRYNVSTHEAWHSRWSSWASATSVKATGASGELPVVGSGGQPAFHVDGALAVATDVAGAYVFNQSGEIDSVAMRLKDKGDSGSTVIDVNVGGISIWVLAASQPEMAASSPSEYILVSNPDHDEVSPGDVVTIDIDQVAGGYPADLDVILYMRGSSDEIASHAHSGGPHTGSLSFSELQYNDDVVLGLSRQGGDGSNWTTPGTTNYTSDSYRIECGSVTIAASTTERLYFQTAFGGAPLVFSQQYNSSTQGEVTSVTSTYVDLKNPGSGSGTFYWMAVGVR